MMMLFYVTGLSFALFVVVRLQYILGEQTWIEYWPTREEGQTDDYKEKYIGITSLAQTLTEFGCTT